MTLTSEQQQALDDLMCRVPRAVAPRPLPAPDFLQTWLGVSSGTVKDALQLLLQQKDGYEQQFRDWVDRNPLDATFEFVGLAAWIFYQAEKDVNPKVDHYVDAFYYIATCVSVGYADIFAMTETGRLVAAVAMAVGPALTGETLDRPTSIQA